MGAGFPGTLDPDRSACRVGETVGLARGQAPKRESVICCQRLKGQDRCQGPGVGGCWAGPRRVHRRLGATISSARELTAVGRSSPDLGAEGGGRGDTSL